MSTVLVDHRVPGPREGGGGGDFADLLSGRGREGGGAGKGHDSYQTAVWVLMIPIVMLFVGLTSAMIVRKGLSSDWKSFHFPGILWLNSLVLIASSISMEVARRSTDYARMRNRLVVTAGLGCIFLAGQLSAWRDLAEQGLFLATNPSSAFFYVLTAAHATHLIGGMIALLWMTARVVQRRLDARRRSALKATATYWHFMDALWIYLLLLLTYWR